MSLGNWLKIMRITVLTPLDLVIDRQADPRQLLIALQFKKIVFSLCSFSCWLTGWNVQWNLVERFEILCSVDKQWLHIWTIVNTHSRSELRMENESNCAPYSLLDPFVRQWISSPGVDEANAGVASREECSLIYGNVSFLHNATVNSLE